ncbi:MAG: hypothetical protein WA003_04745 [Desulfuromonadaceae bacterium]
MTFTVDRTRSFLKIEALNLLSLYRSTHPVVPASDYCLGHLCDAFICVVNEYNLHRVYLALYDQQLKSNLVFTADPFKPDNNKLEALLLEAHGFLENIGFTMEEVNISFSTATREVIMKDIRVMREPSLDLQLETAKMALESLNAEKKEIIQKASREQMELKAELEDLRGQLIAATAAQQASKVEQGALREEGGGVRLPLPDAEKELQQLQEELGSVKTMLKSTRENLKAAKEEVKQARKELKLSMHESDVINEKLKSGEMELARSRDEIDGARRELQEARKAFEAALHDRGADNDDAAAARKTETAGLKAEIKRLTAELAGHDRAHSGEIEILRAALAEANVALSAEKAKIESALQEMEALERNATAELKSLKKRVDSLTAEKQLLEKIAADIKTKAHGEIERQQQVNQSQRKAAIKKLHALKEEVRQLAEARAVIASTTGTPLEQSDSKGSSLQADERKEIPIVSQRAGVSSDQFRSSEAAGFMTTGMPLEQSDIKVSSLQADELKELSFGSQQASFSSDPFGSAESTGSIDFLPDKSLKGIPYSVSTDVVEVYRSYNTINVAPTGNRPQKCDGFVCLVTEGGKCQVYVAWRMNSSEESLICLPDCVAEGEDSCRRILGEGIAYFEKVGFLVDRLPLEEDPDKRQVQLDNLAVFSRTAMDCAA